MQKYMSLEYELHPIQVGYSQGKVPNPDYASVFLTPKPYTLNPKS